MDFGFWDIVVIASLTGFFLARELSKRFHSNEMDPVSESEHVKYRNMVKEVIFCKSEIVDGQIFVYEKLNFLILLLCSKLWLPEPFVRLIVSNNRPYH